MAQYPKMYRGGVQITTLKRSNVEINDANRSSYRVFHKHLGSPGLSYANGCYTIASTTSGGYCSGCEEYSDWYCSLCGWDVSTRLTACANPNCAGYGQNGNNGYRTVKTIYHTSPNGCSNWHDTSVTVYTLGCGYSV